MFYYIEGTVSMLENNLAVLDCSGVGYGISVSSQTLSRLKVGSRARLYIYTLVRDGDNEIAAARKGVDADHMEVQDIVRMALKKITAK